MEKALINGALAMAGLPPLSNETPQLSEQTESERNLNSPSATTETLCHSLPSESAAFRKALFGLDESHHPRVAQLAQAGERYVRKLAHNDFASGRQWMISGGPGTGKTSVARAIYRYAGAFGSDICWEHGGKHLMPLWIDWPDIAEADDQDDFEEACRCVKESNFIVLDDIGSETDRFKTGLPASRLRRILSRTEQKWVIATTNLSRLAFLENYDSRVGDRFRTFKWLSLDGVPSYRGKK